MFVLFKALRHAADTLNTNLHTLNTILCRIDRMNSVFEERLAAIATDVSNITGVVTSVKATFVGLQQQLAAALQDARNQGVNDAQLQQLDDFHTAFKAQAAVLAMAIATDPTPPAPEPVAA